MKKILLLLLLSTPSWATNPVVNYIQSRSTLQAGATIYVSSETVPVIRSSSFTVISTTAYTGLMGTMNGHPISLIVGTTEAIQISTDARVGIGGAPDILNPAEMLHVQSNTTPQGSGSGNQLGAVDILVGNTGSSGARILTQANLSTTTAFGLNIISYIGSAGSGDSGAFWTSGPIKQNSNYMQFQNGSSTVFDFFGIAPSNTDAYFWNEASTGTFHFNAGAAGTEGFKINSAGPVFPSRTLAQLQALTTVAGQTGYCSDCTFDALCVATGTIHSFIEASSKTTACH